MGLLALLASCNGCFLYC